MAKLPCPPQSRIFTLKETGETMSYDQMRQYLMSNPELWSEGAKEAKEGPLSSVEATAKALGEEVKKESVIKKLGYVPYEKAIVIEPQTEFKNLPKGEGEGVSEARSRMIREQESKPPKFTKYPIGTRAIDRFGEVVELREVPLDEIVSRDEGTQLQETIDKYAQWIKEGKDMPPAKGVENFAVEKGKVKITDGNHRYAAAKKAGLKSLPVWVALTDRENVARPIYARNEISSAYHVAKKDGTNPELVKAVEDLLGEKAEGKPLKKGQLLLKDGRVVTPTDIDGQTTFYHGSTKPRKGRLRANWAEGFGEAVYFGTNKRAIEEDYEDQYTTTAQLNLKKPLYYNNKKEWDAVVERAVELYSRKETPKLLDEYSKVVNGAREWYDEDAQAEYEAKGYIEPRSAESWVKEEDASWINKAAQELGYDAIIAPHHSFGNEIAVLDENAIIYPEEIETEGKEATMPKAPYVQEVIPPINEEQAAGEKEVEALKKGDKITTTNPMRLLKGIYGKRNADGSIRSAHTGVNGIFSSITEKIARRYEGEEGVVVFEIPAGVTVETVKVVQSPESKGVAVSAVRQMETDAINASDAQVVKLITMDSRGEESQYIIKDPALRKIGYKPSERKALSPEQELKQAFDKWKSETGKLGIVPNWERQAKADIELFNAAKKYLLTKISQGAYAFEQFLKDLAKAKVENIDEDRSKWKKFYNDTIKEAAPAEEGKTATPPPPVTPPAAGREMPEGEEKETEKPILGRAFRGTTDEAIAEKIVQMGLYRTPANIAEAFEIGQELVSTLGTDKAIELGTKGEVPNGLVRIGILKAVLADINKQRDALKIGEGTKGEEIYMNSLDELNDKYAQALAAFSPSLTESGQVLRAWQEVVQSAEFEFDYEGRKTRYKTLFGDEAYTEEVDERFKEYDRKIKQANKEKQELQEKIDRLEAQGIVDNIDQQKKKATSFFKQAAERVRKLKLSRPGIFSAATPASLAWDATIEAVAVVLEASGTLEEAIAAGIKKLKTTSWYKSLADAKKKEAEEQFSSNVKDTYIVKATVDENGKIQIPSGLLRSYVTSGVKDANAIIDDILSYLKEENPEIIEADVRAAILEVGRKEAPKSAEITKNVNTLKTIIRMIGQLEQVQQGKRITKGEGKQREMDKTIKNLKKQIEQLHIQQFGVKPGALTDEQRLANVKKNALKRISDMKAMQPRPEPRERVKWDAEMSRIANEEFRLKEKWNEEFKEAERKKEGTMKKFFRGSFLAVNFSKTIMTGIGDLGVLLIQGSVLPFRSASVTKEAIANMGRAFLSQEAYVEQLRKINESELYRVIRKSGLDLPQITSLEIERVEEATLGALGETIFDVMFFPFKYVPKIGPKMYEWAKNHINPARVFNRTQTSYMNTLRYGSFALSAQNLMEKGLTYEDNPKSYKDVAAMINTMTGRTRVIGEESAAVMRGLNLVFYSPKNWASVIKMFSPVVLYHVGKRRADSVGVLGMSEAQQTFIRTYASWVATSAALMFLIKAISDSEDEDEEKKRETGNVSVDWENPQSAAFNKIRIGNQIFDPWGGKQQIITLQARMIIHFMGGRAFKDPYTGMEKTLEETPRFKHPLGLMSEYAKGKFSPYMSAVVKLLSSQKAKGREWYIRQSSDGGPNFSLLDPISESYTNITYNAVDDLYSNQPLTISEVMTLFLIAGGGINTLNDQEAKTIVSQIREQVNPGEDEKRRYAANMASRLKDGDVEGATTVYDEAMGIKGVTDKRKLVSLRREGANKMYESASKDVVAQRYGVDDMFRKYLFQVVYENKPIAISSSMTEKKKQVLSALNALTPEQKQEIKLDYDYRYEELMNVAKGIDKLSSQPNKYEKRAGREYWVRQYKKATGKK